MKKYVLPSFLLLFLLSSKVKKPFAQNIPGAPATLEIMEKVADWQLVSWQKEGMRHAKYDWTNGAAYAGFMALNEIANDTRYIKAMYRIGEDIDWNTGPRRTMADDYCVAQMFSQLYLLYRQPKMIAKFKQQADSLVAMPHTESLEWKNHINLREWAWCDALFMGPPALAYLSTATGDKKYLDLASKLWWQTTDYLFDPSENLYYRDGSYFGKKEANGAKVFWSRGNGWVMGGLVRMLENMPNNYPDRARFIELYTKMAEKIATLQSDDGSWHASLLDPESYPAKETSGAGFYCYALAWGVNHGLLSYEKYNPVIKKAWEALTSSVHANGKLGNVQQIGAQPAAVDSNSTEVYGVGAFLLAGSEMIDMALKHATENNIISLYNGTGLERKEEVASFAYNDFISKIKTSGNKNFKISDALTGQEIPYQLEYLGNKRPVNLLLLASLSPGSKVYGRVTNEAPSEFKAKTYARFVPERYDDFAWENDRIGFRVYGKALEKTNENGYGQDIWAKRTPELVINKWYKSGDYHRDHGEGMDFYKVGFTLGAGSCAPYVNDSIYYSKNFRTNKVLDNGPLRSTFQLGYDAWNVNGQSITETKTISLDAGSQLNRMQIEYSFNDKKDPMVIGLPIAVGIVKRDEDGAMKLDEKTGVMGYWEPQHGKDGTMGVGSIMEEPVVNMKVADNHLLTIINANSKKPFVYYTGAAWDKAGLITNATEWFTYLQNFKEKIKRPVVFGWMK